MEPKRKERRALDRELRKIMAAKDKLALLSPGFSDARPIEVASASLVELQSRGIPCHQCGGEVRVVEHAAEMRHGLSTRVVKGRCVACGTERELFFRIRVVN